MVGDMIEQKVRTTIYLEKEAKRLVEDEVENFSQWVNEKVYTCLSCENVEDVLAKKKELEIKIHTLDLRLKDLEARKADKNSEDSFSKQALVDLREFFSPRGEQGLSRESNLSWILSPKNVGRCKILKKSPEQVLDELEAWFDGTKKSDYEEN